MAIKNIQLDAKEQKVPASGAKTFWDSEITGFGVHNHSGGTVTGG